MHACSLVHVRRFNEDVAVFPGIIVTLVFLIFYWLLMLWSFGSFLRIHSYVYTESDFPHCLGNSVTSLRRCILFVGIIAYRFLTTIATPAR